MNEYEWMSMNEWVWNVDNETGSEYRAHARWHGYVKPIKLSNAYRSLSTCYEAPEIIKVCFLTYPNIFVVCVYFSGSQLGNALTFPIAGLLCAYGFDGGWPSIFYCTGKNLTLLKQL